MGFDDYSNSKGFCKSGDQVIFKVWDASSNELINMESGEDIVWQNLNASVIT